MTAFAVTVSLLPFGAISTLSRSRRDCRHRAARTTASIPPPAPLRNVNVLLRHGESIPNITGTIVSTAASGSLDANGLTDVGRLQAEEAARNLKDLMDRHGLPRMLVLSSDFSRAFETACILRDVVSAVELRQDARLRERFFGIHDGRSNRFYEDVWRADASEEEGCHKATGVESVFSVRGRMVQCIREQEMLSRSSGTRQLIVLSSHGDALQIAETFFHGICPSRHRELPHLGNCELRVHPPEVL